MHQFKDTDFLHASARVRSLERNLLGSRQLTQMVESATLEEAYKIVNDAGIGVGTGVREYESALKESLLETYRLVESLSGDSGLFHVFRYEHDGLNLKILIKAQALAKEPSGMLTDLGTVPAATLQEQFRQKKFDRLPTPLIQAAEAALEELAKTGDPQIVDILIDKAVLAAMKEQVDRYDNKFLRNYVHTKIDISNLRCLVRIRRIGAGTDFVRRVLSPGGSMSENSLLEAYAKGMEGVLSFLEGSRYGQALEPAMADLRAGGSLALFEKLCDNLMVRLLEDARLIPFGVEPLVVYLCAKENEVKAARIVLASRVAGVDREQIKERLRESYA